jgi:UDP-N-acetylglucosamine 2-epimerase (hydrolysing)
MLEIPDNITDHFNFGDGNSDQLFFELLQSDKLWSIRHQKQFQDIDHE